MPIVVNNTTAQAQQAPAAPAAPATPAAAPVTNTNPNNEVNMNVSQENTPVSQENTPVSQENTPVSPATAAPAAKVGLLAKTWNATKDGFKGSYEAVKTATHAGHLQGQVYVLQVMDKVGKIKFLEISDDVEGLKAKAVRYAKLGLKWTIIGLAAVPSYLQGFCVGAVKGFSAALKGEQEKLDITAKLKADKEAFNVASSEAK